MNYKNFLIVFFFITSACSTFTITDSKIKSFKKKNFQNKGFTLLYSDMLFKNKIISKKMDNRGLVIFQKNLKKGTTVKIKNILNNKTIIAKVGNKSKYPIFNNSVISNRISKEIDLNLNEPYIEIIEILHNSSFVAKKAKTFEEEKKVADKAPVDSITIQNIGITETSKVTKNINEFKNFRYIIKFADLYFEDSAIMLKERLFNEFNIKNVSIDKLSTNSFRVYIGPFKSLDSLKNGFNDINNLDFENIEILKL